MTERTWTPDYEISDLTRRAFLGLTLLAPLVYVAGRTDDTAALQHFTDEAVARGAVVNIPPGTYHLTRPLIARGDFRLIGSRVVFGRQGQIDLTRCDRYEVCENYFDCRGLAAGVLLSAGGSR